MSERGPLDGVTWVGPHEPTVAAPGARPVHWLRTTFTVPAAAIGAGGEAQLHCSARGLIEVHVNGVCITDDVLLPGFTQYRVRIPYRTYEIAGLLHEGVNTVAVLLADGWFRGQTGMPRAVDQWGSATSCALRIVGADGAACCETGSHWRSVPSHILAADLMAGQVEDRRLVDPTVHDAASVLGDRWHPVVPADPPAAALVPYDAPPVRRTQVLPAVSVVRLPDGAHVADFAQNLSGWCRMRNLGPAGTRTTLHHAEWAMPDGDITTANLVVNVPILPAPLEPGMVDEVVSAGVEGDVFEPAFTTHGFRYVRIEGHPGPLTTADIEAVAVHSDLTRTGWFDCSDPRLNRLHEAAVWSMRSNICEIPTDCPQRERSGWVGDWQIFVPTAAFLFDVEAFTRKWLTDVRADQRDDGAVANISPSNVFEGFGGPLGGLNASAGWGDVVVHAPLVLHEVYESVAAIEENLDAMRRWIDFGLRSAAGGRSAARAAAGPERRHERYLWDTGFHWGEWLEPGVDLGDFFAFKAADKSEVASAYLSRSCAMFAALCPDRAIADEYAAIGAAVRDAWRTEFLRDGLPVTQTQAAHVRALAFGLVDDAARAATADRLAALVCAAGTTVGTGFLSTPFLLPVLADHGHLDLAYELLLQPNEPGWMVMLDRGATTVWERWEGVGSDGVPHESLNHYSKAAVVSFLHRTVAGLRATAPGYATFAVAPRPGGGLTRAHAAFASRHGRIDVAWERTGGAFTLTVDVPPGTRASVTLPSGAVHDATPGQHRWSEPG